MSKTNVNYDNYKYKESEKQLEKEFRKKIYKKYGDKDFRVATTSICTDDDNLSR